MRKLIVIAIILLTGMGVSFNNTKKVNEKWGDNGTANRIDTSLSEESKERLEKNQQEIEKIINDEKIAEGIVEETKVSEQDEKVKQEQKNETTQVQSNSKHQNRRKKYNKLHLNKKKKYIALMVGKLTLQEMEQMNTDIIKLGMRHLVLMKNIQRVGNQVILK